MKRTASGSGGKVCLLDPGHGESYVLRDGVDWCAHSDHSAGKPPTPSLLIKQQEWLDAKAQAVAEPEPVAG